MGGWALDSVERIRVDQRGRGDETKETNHLQFAFFSHQLSFFFVLRDSVRFKGSCSFFSFKILNVGEKSGAKGHQCNCFSIG